MEQQLIIFDFDDTILSSSDNNKVVHDAMLDLMTYTRYPKYDVVILTARYKRGPVVEFFKNLGINEIDIVAVGELNPLAKSSYVMNKLSEKQYSMVKVYEDKSQNIEAIKKVVDSLGIPFHYVHVDHDSQYSDLRDFIGLTFSEEQDVAKSDGSGIVVLRKFGKKWKVLALELNGKYDLPKGKIEKKETELQAAVRETKEESGIDDLQFTWGNVSTRIRHLTFFIAQTDQDAYIPQNPESGIYEHDRALWLSFKNIKSKCYGYLLPIIEWAEDIVIK